MDSEIRFLGIDPSLRGTSVVESDPVGGLIGVHRVRFPKLKELDLLEALDKGFRQILDERKGQKIFLAIEDMSLNSPFFVFGQYFVQAIYRLALKQSGFPFVIISPSKVKSFLGVGKKQDKESVRLAAEKLYPNIVFPAKLKDDNDVDAFLLSRMGAISWAMLSGEIVPEEHWMTPRHIGLFHGDAVKKSKGRYKGMAILPGIVQRSEFLINWPYPKPYGWCDL